MCSTTGEDPDKDAQIKDRLRGEAYFLRAWWHFELLRMYGGKSADSKALEVPVADHYISYEEASENGMFIRPSYQATVDFICNDWILPWNFFRLPYSGSDQISGDTQIRACHKRGCCRSEKPGTSLQRQPCNAG